MQDINNDVPHDIKAVFNTHALSHTQDLIGVYSYLTHVKLLITSNLFPYLFQWD